VRKQQFRIPSPAPREPLLGVAVLIDPPDGTVLSADVAVVGSGAGGAAVAGELRRAGATVILLEAGGIPDLPLGSHVHTRFPREDQLEFEYGPAVWSQLTAPQGSAYPIPGIAGARSAHGVGGLLSYWSHMCARPDYASEGEQVVPQQEMESLWDDAMRLLWADTSIEAEGVRQRRLLRRVAALYPELPRGREVQQLPIAARRTAAGTLEYAAIGALLDAPPTAPDLTIVPGRPARRIEMHGGVAIGIEAAGLRGRPRLSIRAGVVVVAGGAIGSPQLLVASGIRPQAIGRYLTDHTMLASRVKLADGLLADVPTDDPAFSVWVPAGPGRPIHTQIARGWVSAAPFVSDVDHRSTADISQFAGVEPDPDNRLIFDEHHPDAWGMPSISARFTRSPADRAAIDRALVEHRAIADAIRDPDSGYAVSLAPPGGSLHLMGTTRLGRDEMESVADSTGRVWGTANVYVAGNSVISTRNAGNPTVNTVALGLRTARSIRVRGARP
jgi:choline dehydrogenase-like flavoprotein